MEVTDKSKRLSKQQAADLADKEHDNEIRKSIKRSNLTRQQEFKKMKKNQKKAGRIGSLPWDRSVSYAFVLV